ncbi:fumarylacetoacetate hydrolase family protein [Glaciecola sp. 33A]|jgi:2-keto-4-pentenoate hydratase/2-oxohepta-3-ene-1,7-dioic acid hydratase in catechol pathway|uniref:fumarylacetoacetate hydrolase family protein n=1 Tax=Glaciecola sp. 33A TaxID=2057807 RepID=UPI000C34B984|nr:fumarylacetoacetate hydrolase family protein [Glaciecola sp. 33A]PKH99885.1 isomerase/hydrolase [Glaciecola sp. 33A]
MFASESAQRVSYRHNDQHGQAIGLPVGKVVCVGRNYMDHIQEMSNQVSEVPLLFMKPSTAVVDMREPVAVPTIQGECHNELEVAVLIAAKLTKVTPEQASKAVYAIGLGLDLTLRDEQSRLKEIGQPWERAKSFDGSCPLSPFVLVNSLSNNDHFVFQLHINEQLVQSGDTNLMLTPILQLISEISHHFTLLPGDVILTGTPKGVGPLHVGDKITAVLEGHLSISTRVSSQ